MTTQPIPSVPAQSTANTNGQINLSFPYVPQGLWWQGTVNIPNSPSTAIWTASISGTKAGSWIGASAGGPFTIGPMDQLTISGIGLNPNETVQAYLSGISSDSQLQPGIAANVLVTDSATVLFENETIAYNGSYTDSRLPMLAPIFHTVVFTVHGVTQAGISGFVQVVDLGTGATLYDLPFAFGTQDASFQVPVAGISATSMGVEIGIVNTSSGGQSILVNAYADTLSIAPHLVDINSSQQAPVFISPIYINGGSNTFGSYPNPAVPATITLSTGTPAVWTTFGVASMLMGSLEVNWSFQSIGIVPSTSCVILKILDSVTDVVYWHYDITEISSTASIGHDRRSFQSPVRIVNKPQVLIELGNGATSASITGVISAEIYSF